MSTEARVCGGGMVPFLVKHIESLESVQSKAVLFIGKFKGRGGESKKRGIGS